MKDRRSILWLSLIFTAIFLRFWGLSDLGLTHFDEGSYAMAGQWISSLGSAGAPPQAGHAPALFPVLVGLAFFLFGAQDFVAIAVSATAGTLTVVLIWRIGRSWFDDRIAAGAALFLATCEYHLIYSRMALTDATFTLLLWASLALLFEGLRQGRSAAFLLGGVACGLAWNTKYHGLLSLAIALLFCLAGLVTRRRDLRGMSRRAPHLLGSAAVALALMLPWVLAVGLTTGWTPVLAGQWSHSFGSGFWPPTLPRTLLYYLSSWIPWPVLLLSLAGVVFLIRKLSPPGLFLLTSVLCLGLAPLGYASFPRLLLPLVPGLCLLAALGVVACLKVLPGIPSGRSVPLAFLAVAVWSTIQALPVLRLSTDSYREAAGLLAAQETPVLSQLSKNYYFYDQGRSVEMRWHEPRVLEDLVASRPEWMVAVDPVLEKIGPQRAWFERHRASLAGVRDIPIRAYEVVGFQGIRRPWRPGTGNLPGAHPGERPEIRIFRLKSAPD